MYDTGFVFIELYTRRLAEYYRFFRDVCGFHLIRDEGDFIELRSKTALILLNGGSDLPDDHPFQYRANVPGGIGVEIGIALSGIEDRWCEAKKFPDWIVTDIKSQEWGMTDFRVTTPDGYYLRLTTYPDESGN